MSSVYSSPRTSPTRPTSDLPADPHRDGDVNAKPRPTQNSLISAIVLHLVFYSFPRYTFSNHAVDTAATPLQADPRSTSSADPPATSSKPAFSLYNPFDHTPFPNTAIPSPAPLASAKSNPSPPSQTLNAEICPYTLTARISWSTSSHSPSPSPLPLPGSSGAGCAGMRRKRPEIVMVLGRSSFAGAWDANVAGAAGGNQNHRWSEDQDQGAKMPKSGELGGMLARFTTLSNSSPGEPSPE